ncbi:MAG: nucleoside deaminase [Verrucomicrobia bacterium]|nr:nucleoside deaminase [Verrucomicrobiota bacterium]
MSEDEDYLKHAIRQAREHKDAGHGGPFGAVIVHEGQIIAEGWNQVTGTNDPTAHAEVVAIRGATARLGRFSLEGCTLYTSCEPCPMCLAAAYWARVEGIVYAATRQDAAEIGFDDEYLYQQLALPIQQRSLSMQQEQRDQALEVFRAWQNKSDKICY